MVDTLKGIVAVCLLLTIVACGDNSTTRPGSVAVVFCVDTESDGFDYHQHSQSLNLLAFAPGNIVDQALDSSWRMSMVDSNGEPLKFSWYLMTIPAYQHTPQGASAVVDAFADRYANRAVALGDEVAWHYHHSHWYVNPQDTTSGEWVRLESFGDTSADSEKSDREHALDNLATFMASSREYPTSFRAGWNWENTDFSNWLDSVVPFDYSNFWSQTDTLPTVYHPCKADLYQVGTSPRLLVRCHPAPDSEYIAATVETARRGNDVILALYTHNYGSSRRSNNAIMDRAGELHEWVSEQCRRYDIDFMYMTASDGAKWIEGVDSSVAAQAESSCIDHTLHFKPRFEPSTTPVVCCWQSNGDVSGHFMQPGDTSNCWSFPLDTIKADSLLIGTVTSRGEGFVSEVVVIPSSSQLQ